MVVFSPFFEIIITAALFLVRGLENNIRGQASYWNAVYMLRFPMVGPKLHCFDMDKRR